VKSPVAPLCRACWLSSHRVSVIGSVSNSSLADTDLGADVAAMFALKVRHGYDRLVRNRGQLDRSMYYGSGFIMARTLAGDESQKFLRTDFGSARV